MGIGQAVVLRVDFRSGVENGGGSFCWAERVRQPSEIKREIRDSCINKSQYGRTQRKEEGRNSGVEQKKGKELTLFIKRRNLENGRAMGLSHTRRVKGSAGATRVETDFNRRICEIGVRLE